MRVLVTGGNSRLGLAISKCFFDNGWEVVKTSTSGKDGIKLDLRQGIPAGFISEVGEIDCLVNNAGVFTEGLQEELSEESFDRVFSINMRGLFLVVKALLPGLKKNNGSIVNISSMNALHPGFGKTAHYDASKGAVSAYTASLAEETGLRVNAVAPGLISADYLCNSELEKRFKSHSVAGSLVSPCDVAKAVYFLATSQGIYGQTLLVDNGYLLK